MIDHHDSCPSGRKFCRRVSVACFRPRPEVVDPAGRHIGGELFIRVVYMLADTLLNCSVSRKLLFLSFYI